MTAAFERFGKRSKMQDEVTSKLGGNPHPAVEIPADCTFLAQLEVGEKIFYVFVRDDEKGAIVTVRSRGAR
jgi:hypothetical protein